MSEYLSRARLAEIREEAMGGEPTKRSTVLALLNEIERLSEMIEREREVFSLTSLRQMGITK